MNAEVIESPATMQSSTGTSGGGSLLTKSLGIIWIAGALYFPGTVSGGVPSELMLEPSVQTNAGFRVVDGHPASSDVMELRRLSGLTWDQLARLFGVARRTVHFWASGKTLNSGNLEKLQRVLTAIRQIDKGSARANLTALFSSRSDGVLVFDLLLDGRYAEAIASQGDGQGRAHTALSPLSSEARSLRAPIRPENLVGALHDSAHRDIGKPKVARSTRTRKLSRGGEDR